MQLFQVIGLLGLLINQINAVNVFAAQLAATNALQNAFRTQEMDGWLAAVHTDFTSDSYCASDYLFQFPDAACIATPLNATEFYNNNVPLASLLVNISTFEWRTNPDPFVKEGKTGAVTMTTALDELHSGLHLESTMLTFIDVEKENGIWKVIKWRFMQDTVYLQNIFCRVGLSFGAGEDAACNISAVPPNNNGV